MKRKFGIVLFALLLPFLGYSQEPHSKPPSEWEWIPIPDSPRKSKAEKGTPYHPLEGIWELDVSHQEAIALYNFKIPRKLTITKATIYFEKGVPISLEYEGTHIFGQQPEQSFGGYLKVGYLHDSETFFADEFILEFLDPNQGIEKKTSKKKIERQFTSIFRVKNLFSKTQPLKFQAILEERVRYFRKVNKKDTVPVFTEENSKKDWVWIEIEKDRKFKSHIYSYVKKDKNKRSWKNLLGTNNFKK